MTVEVKTLYISMQRFPLQFTKAVQIICPKETFITLNGKLSLLVVVKDENGYVYDADLIGEYIVDDQLIETVEFTHTREGIYKGVFSMITHDYGLIRLRTLNYESEEYVFLQKSVSFDPIVRKVLTNNWEIKDNQLIIYDDDGETPLLIFNLYDKLGNPTEMNVYRRVRVQ